MRDTAPFNKVVIPYLQLIRPINIAIVFITQCILYFGIINKGFEKPALHVFNVLLLSLCTCIIAACGNIINDYYDRHIDLVNKPQRTYIGQFISPLRALLYYWILNLAGFLIALYIAMDTTNIPLLPIYPIAQWLLYMYAKHLKTKGLIGNIIVAFMTSFVAIIIIVAERKNLIQASGNNALILLCGFAAFAFLINLIRELVKDLEDTVGDEKFGSASFPIIHGSLQTKVLIYFNMIAFLILLIFFHTTYIESVVLDVYAILFLIIPSIYFLKSLSRSNEKTMYRRLSYMLKGILISGLIYILIISFLQSF